MIKSEQQQITAEERPLVTFALFAYNQEKYIREALEGAFSQTYSPLQVILSDDCSSDRTYEIMQEEAEKYSGPHSIVLNRNQHNLGIGGHVNRMMELADGELIVVAAGDDISLPTRTAVLVTHWLSNKEHYHSLCSTVYTIDSCGRELGEIYSKASVEASLENHVKQDGVILGAAHAWSSRVFSYFGPLSRELINEDAAIGLRSALLGGIKIINEPLVKYRIDSGISGYGLSKKSSDPLAAKIRDARRIHILMAQYMSDIKKYSSINKNYRIVDNVYKFIKKQDCYCRFVISAFGERRILSGALGALKCGVRAKRVIAESVKAALPSLYSHWYRRFKNV